MKNFRKKYCGYYGTNPETGRKKWYQTRTVKYFACGEYGDDNGRPHYHMLLFNFDFADKKFFKRNKNGDPLYTSQEAQLLWPEGFVTLGGVSFQSSAYVARYIMKKRTGDQAAEHYEYVVPETGEVVQRTPEFVLSSNGLGAAWLEKYWTDVYPHDYVIVDEKKLPVPRYYSKILLKKDEAEYERLKRKRKKGARENAWNSTPERLRVREQVKTAAISQLKRPL